MHKTIVAALFLGPIVLLETVELALAEPDVRTIANGCTICHGTDGRSPGSIDSLAGLSTDEFIEEMQEFKYEEGEPSFINACYGLLAPDCAITVAAVYEMTADGVHPIEGAGGTSPLKASAGYREKEAKDVTGLYQSIVADNFS